MSQSVNSESSNLIPKPPEHEKPLPENTPSKISNQKAPKPYLNKPVSCPWTSTAPLASTSTQRIIEGPRSFSEAYVLRDHYVRVIRQANNQLSHINNKFNNGFTSSGFTNRYAECHRASSAQFFHFLRLMQLFPDVHPATLHTVMTLCKNDFFATVDKLLYAKRCKELTLKQQLLPPTNKGRVRYQPYSFKSNCNDNVKLVPNYKNSGLTNSCQPLNNTGAQTACDANLPSRPLDSKRIVYKNKSKGKESKVGTQFTPVAPPKIEIPITPLSPNPDVP